VVTPGSRIRLPGPTGYYETKLARGGCYTPLSHVVTSCVVCQKSEEEKSLQKCPICFTWVCLDCGKREYGRTFCSKRCADAFFHGDDDE